MGNTGRRKPADRPLHSGTLPARMSESPLLILEQPMAERVDIIRTDYVEHMLADYIARDGEEAGWLNFRDYLLKPSTVSGNAWAGRATRNFAP